MNRFGLIMLILCFPLFIMAEQRRLLITDFGAVPNSRKAVNSAFKAALEACGNKDAIIEFPSGRYDFWQDFTRMETTGMHLEGAKNITIEGNGSEFVFHGRMRVLQLYGSENVIVRNFSIDWDRPFISQGEFIAITDAYVDLRIDKTQYPFVIEDHKICFTGEGWSSDVKGYLNNYDKHTGDIAYRTRDEYTGNIFNGKAEEIAEGVVRFYGKPRKQQIPVRPGQIITLYHGTYILPGIEIGKCRNILLKDMTIYHALSHAVYAYRSENITMEQVSTTPRTDKKRVFSGVADASHITCCKGLILVEGCRHAGQGDDFLNVHGTYSEVLEVLGDSRVKLNHKSSFFDISDTLWMINPFTLQRESEVVVKEIRQSFDKEQRPDGFEFVFAGPLPKGLQAGCFLENKTWTPEVIVRNCCFLRKNRARGMLVTTPKKVLIENNYFSTAGASILIEGDLTDWFESGAHEHVLIRNNVFENCMSSGCDTGGRWEWGEAPITISPSFRPDDTDSPTYHRNITISGNTFICFDAPVLFARSVDRLTFEDNKLLKSEAFPPFLWQKSNVYLDGCRHVVIRGNKVADNFPARSVEIRHMKRKDVFIHRNNAFRLVGLP